MKRKWDLADVQVAFTYATTVLFWAPLITSIIGWYDVSTYLFVAFFFSFGMSMIIGAIIFMEDSENHSKTARFFQWGFLIAGLFMIVVGMGILEFEPIIFLLFSLPVMRLLSRRSITDILKAKPGDKHPWMDHVSDGLFIMSALLFILMFFGFLTKATVSLMFISLASSLILDQIHYGINKDDWGAASGMISIALTIFLLPGILILFWT